MANVDFDKRSFVKNLCSWAISFRLPNSKADAYLEPNQKLAFNNGDLVTLIENGNVLFCGTGSGNHARLYIENEDLRKYVGFESEDGKEKQFILDDNACQKILDYKTSKAFKEHINSEVIAKHEKNKIMEYARKIKLNDFEKIDFLEEYTKLKFKEDKKENKEE